MLHVVGRQTRQFKYIFLQEVKEISAVTSSKLRVCDTLIARALRVLYDLMKDIYTVYPY